MRINEATRLTCSAGIGPNRLIAKICSDINKPNGQAYVRPILDEVLEFIGNQTIRKIPYIGGMKETTLQAMGFKTGRDLRDRACDLMIAFLEHEHTFLIKCGMGIG
jgi:nucleotidyltransferase/DNA polymerase involved in DNA repair